VRSDCAEAKNRLQIAGRAITLSRMKLSIKHVVLFALCTVAAVALEQTPAAQQAAAPKLSPPVEMAQESHHHLVLSNAYVRAYYIDVPPQQSTLMHHHSTDYLGIALGHTEIDSITPDGKSKHVVLEDGDVRYTPAGLTHVATDQAVTPFRNATIELLQNQGHLVCVQHCENDPRAKDWPPLPAGITAVGYGDTFRISATTVPAGQSAAQLAPYPYLLVALTPLHVKNLLQAKGQPIAEQKIGGMVWIEGGQAHQPIVNLENAEARWVSIEFKPGKE